MARYPNEAFKSKELARRLSFKSQQDYQIFKEALRVLVNANKVKRIKGGRFGHFEIPQSVAGIFKMTKQGFGTVLAEGSGDVVSIAPRDRGMAVHGDTVEVSLFAQSSKRLEKGQPREGEVIKIVQRGRTELVGTLERSKNFFIVIPDDRKIARDVFVDKEFLNKAVPGDKVVVKIEEWGVGHLNPEGRVVEVLGKAGEVSAELKSVIREFKLPLHFPPEVMREAESLPAAIPDSEIMERLDLRGELCFTIDPEDAKDFDDAVSLTELPGGDCRLGVHIADVSFYVKEGGEVDREALKRGTSVYFPNMVVPMIPERLSNMLCSLRPDEDRLTYSVLMTVTAKGTVKDYDIVESIIRSKRRFSYEEVEKLLDVPAGQTSGAGVDEKTLASVHAMQKLSTMLTKKRLKEGSIDFETAEAKFYFDAEGKPSEIHKKARLRSHRLVEEFMLLANQVVARHIGLAKKEDHRKPFLYRIHDSPDPDRIRELAAFVEPFGYKLRVDVGVPSKDLQKLLDQVQGTEVENVINKVALRAMAKAIYSEQNIGHYGLGFEYYSHFTSPIRRYPDLVIHRLLKDYARSASVERRNEIAKRLPFIAKQSSAMERVAMEAERAGVKVMQVEFMKRHVGDEFHGVISGVMRFGIFIEITDLLVEGLVHVRDLNDDYYEYDEKKYALIGSRTGKRYRLGDAVQVKVLRVNPEEREIDFAILGSEQDEAPPQRRRRR
ncbi:MAG: ribonuclease R [Ignavibacteriales bacterium]|nr:ribonuclease R [Ignavibacteriales bacterium]